MLHILKFSAPQVAIIRRRDHLKEVIVVMRLHTRLLLTRLATLLDMHDLLLVLQLPYYGFLYLLLQDLLYGLTGLVCREC